MNEEKPHDLRARTKAFALRVIRLYASLPKTTEAQVPGEQILRSGTPVGAHYHEARRARSTPEFVGKIGGGLQELEETIYRLDLLADSRIIPAARLTELHREAEELAAILVSSVKTAKLRR